MTLNTKFIISDPWAKPREIFDYCQEIIGTVNPQWEHKRQPKYEWDINPEFHNYLGQGFSAALSVKYGADGPLLCWDSEKKEAINYEPRGYIEVSFDTAYGYHGTDGKNCNQLHANYIKQLGKWCEENNWEYHWQNEYTGEWFNDWQLADILDK